MLGVPKYDLRAEHYFIAKASRKCWKCQASTSVYCLFLPAEFESLEDVDPDEAGFGPNDDYSDAEFQAWSDGPDSREWRVIEIPAAISNLQHIPRAVIEQLLIYTEDYRPDHSKQAGQVYWMNHCDQCGMKQGDFLLHSEPGGPFFPTTEVEASSIVLYRVNEPFLAQGGYSLKTNMCVMFEHMVISAATTKA